MTLGSTFHGALLLQDVVILINARHIVHALNGAPRGKRFREGKHVAVVAVVAHGRPLCPRPHVGLEEALVRPVRVSGGSAWTNNHFWSF